MLYIIFICMLYERFLEIKNIKFGPISSNKMAVDINIQDEVNIDNRFEELMKYSKDLMIRNIDAEQFEEHVNNIMYLKMLCLLKFITSNGTDQLSEASIIETANNEIRYFQNEENDHIGLQNVDVKDHELHLRSSIDYASLIRWDIENPINDWSFTRCYEL